MAMERYWQMGLVEPLGNMAIAAAAAVTCIEGWSQVGLDGAALGAALPAFGVALTALCFAYIALAVGYIALGAPFAAFGVAVGTWVLL
jgi:hypothetical protein